MYAQGEGPDCTDSSYLSIVTVNRWRIGIGKSTSSQSRGRGRVILLESRPLAVSGAGVRWVQKHRDTSLPVPGIAFPKVQEFV